MGRPKGSKNKTSAASAPVTPAPAAAPAAAAVAIKKRGRPPGSTNKKPAAATPPVAPAPATPAVPVKVPGKRGRPPGSTNKKPAGAPVSNPSADPVVVPEVVVTPVSDEDTQAAQVAAARTEDATPLPNYTIEDLKSDALAEIVDHVGAIAKYASNGRRNFFESKSIPGLTYNQRVTKLMLDFFEIDVPKLIEEFESK